MLLEKIIETYNLNKILSETVSGKKLKITHRYPLVTPHSFYVQIT